MIIVGSDSAPRVGDVVGAPEPLVSLYSARFAELVRTAALLLGHVDEAEEIVQEAFVRTLKAWPRLHDVSRVESYLLSVMLNLARSKIRRRAIARHRGLPVDASLPSTEEKVVLREEYRTVLGELWRLPKRQRECLVLRYYLGLSESEVAEVLGISVGSVKTHTHRGIEKIRKALEVAS